MKFPATIDGMKSILAGTEIYSGNFIFDYKLYKEYNTNSLHLTNQFIYLVGGIKQEKSEVLL